MRAGWLLKVETSPPCNPALDKKEQKMDDGDDPNHTTECFDLETP